MTCDWKIRINFEEFKFLKPSSLIVVFNIFDKCILYKKNSKENHTFMLLNCPKFFPPVKKTDDCIFYLYFRSILVMMNKK